MSTKNLIKLLIIVGVTGCILSIIHLIFRISILSVPIWICLGIFIFIGIWIWRRDKSKRCCENEVQRYFINTLSKRLTKYDYGKSLWNRFIKMYLITEHTKLMIAFPIESISVTSSFIQGFLSEYTNKYGWRKAKENITILGETTLVAKFNDELNNR